MLHEMDKAEPYDATRKARRVRSVSTRRIHGIPLTSTKSIDLTAIEFPFPIRGCLCVQDTPDNPCPCTDLVIWILDRPLEMSKTGRRTADGDEILDFRLRRDAEVSVELHLPMKLAELDRIAGMAQRRRERAKTGSAAAAPAPPLGWVTLAASAGYAVGTLLEDLLGSNKGSNDNLSGDMANWAAENLPAPDWLQDIF